MKKFALLGLAILAVTIMLYAGLQGIINHHSYGTVFIFIGAITTIGLGIDVVNHLRIHNREAYIRKLNGL